MSSPLLLGRSAQIHAIDELIAGVRERGAALVICGDPGIGKSVLLDDGARSARSRGMRVLTTVGVQSESHLPFAGLHQLLRPILDHVDDLPGPQRDALLAAFGMAQAAGPEPFIAPEPFLIALAALDLLADAAARAPVLLIAEDVHWLDRGSSDVLAFIARRVESDPIVLLATARSGFDSPLVGAGLPELRLEGIDDDSAAALLDKHAPGLVPALRDRLLEEAAGNPLALVELPAASNGLPDGRRLPDWLPLTERLEHAFAGRMSELPRTSRALLLLAAVDDGGLVAEVLAAAPELIGDAATLDDLTPAVDAGLVHVDGPALRFRHPLVRSAIHQTAGVAERNAAHRALATVLADDPDRRVWHRAASTIGHDRAVATELDDAAARARRRGAIAMAVDALELAAGFSDDAATAGDRLLRAAQLAYELGNRDVVVRLLQEADPLDLGPEGDTRKAWIRESFDDGIPGDAARVVSLADTADRERAGGNTDLALNLLWAAALRCWWADPGEEARARVVGGAERFPGSDPRVMAILSFAAPVERGATVFDALQDASPEALTDPLRARFAAVAATGVGAFDDAVGLYAPSIAGLRAQGRLGLLARALSLQAWSAAHVADLRLAIPAGEEGARLARETSQPLIVATALVSEAVARGMQGDEPRADALAGEAEQIALGTGAHAVLSAAQVARGRAALGAGRHAEAYEHLQRLYDPADLAYNRALGCFVIADLAEAAVHSGHRDQGAAVVDAYEGIGNLTPSPLLHLGLRHARALIAADGEAEALYRRALDADMSRWPFVRARVQLSYGEWLRRRRRMADSRAPLRAARDTLDALGVIPWGERARQELRASGETSRRRTPEARDQLTAQELQIAQLAAEGLTNREIGQRLYLSHRTIGSHLYRIFPKLGITSRAELRGALTDAALEPVT